LAVLDIPSELTARVRFPQTTGPAATKEPLLASPFAPQGWSCLESGSLLLCHRGLKKDSVTGNKIGMDGVLHFGQDQLSRIVKHRFHPRVGLSATLHASAASVARKRRGFVRAGCCTGGSNGAYFCRPCPNTDRLAVVDVDI